MTIVWLAHKDEIKAVFWELEDDSWFTFAITTPYATSHDNWIKCMVK